MQPHDMTLDELIQTLNAGGFDVVDDRGTVLDVGPDSEAVDEDLMQAPVVVRLRERTDLSGQAVLGDVVVSGNTFQIVGDARNLDALRSLLASDTRLSKGGGAGRARLEGAGPEDVERP